MCDEHVASEPLGFVEGGVGELEEFGCRRAWRAGNMRDACRDRNDESMVARVGDQGPKYFQDEPLSEQLRSRRAPTFTTVKVIESMTAVPSVRAMA